jgi:hypothetical protein
MKTFWRSVPLIGLLFLLCIGAALFTLRATAQNRPSADRSVEEESATIKDDPTVAPDAAQSSDHNISFPVDI